MLKAMSNVLEIYKTYLYIWIYIIDWVTDKKLSKQVLYIEIYQMQREQK